MIKIINEYNDKGVTIYSLERSGSTYLLELTSSTVKNLDIIFREKRYENINITNKFREYCNNSYNSKYQGFVCKTFNNPYSLKTDIYNIPKSYNIFLIRKNILEGLLSQSYATVSGEWVLFDSSKLNKMYVSLNIFKKLLAERIRKLNLLIKNSHKIKFDIIMDYDDLSLNRNEDIKLLKMTKHRELSSKTIGFPKKELLIENLDELKEYFNSVKHTIKIENATVENGIITDFTVQHQG